LDTAHRAHTPAAYVHAAARRAHPTAAASVHASTANVSASAAAALLGENRGCNC
jgi:hypothetical protein